MTPPVSGNAYELQLDDAGEKTESGEGELETLVTARSDEPGVVRPALTRSETLFREAPANVEPASSERTAKLFRIKPEVPAELPAVLPSVSTPSTIAEFYLSPPRSLPVIDGVRPRVAGKFLFVGDEKFYIRGVTYGPFRPDEEGCEYHTPEQVEQDFELMARYGINSVRTYTVPPRWLLDIAQKHGLRVMIGLPWEEHITFLDNRKLAQDIERRVREGVRACAGHPALLAYTIGNEIPATIVRWSGR
ncbi:MAG: glycosyl transferase, partial [Syntrophobacteraceae bacterium]|nr:glycosyl transferase [Syntrophobacteraceae bacterium]